MKLRLFNILCLAILITSSCSSSKEIYGTYSSNYAEAGFFITRLQLNNDLTFAYLKRGDLMRDSASGRFIKSGNNLILVFDTLKIIPDSFQLRFMKENNLPLSALEPLKLPRPNELRIQNNKLYVVKEDGKVVEKYKIVSSKRVKYYLGKL